MMRPFRSLSSQQNKDDVYRVSGLRTASAPTANPFSSGVACSNIAVAIPHNIKGSIITMPTDYSQFNRTDSPCLLSAHGGSDITDLAFSPHGDNVIASVGRDDRLVVFQIPADGIVTSSGTVPAVTVSDLTGASALAWNPVVKGLVAVGLKDSIAVVSVDFEGFGTDVVPTTSIEGRVIYRHSLPYQTGCDCVALTWSRDGSTISAIGKDGSFFVFDPRKHAHDVPLVNVGSNLGDMKNPMFSSFVGPIDGLTRLFVLGLGRARKPCWRMLSVADNGDVSPIANGDLMISTGQIIANYDHASKCLYVASRGAQSIYIYDLVPILTPSPNAMLFNPVLNVPISGTKGFNLLPRRSLSVMDAHVATLMSHIGEGLESHVVNALRKEKKFHEDLYPDADSTEAAIDFDSWADGANSLPKTVSLSPYNFNTSTSTPSTSVTDSTPQFSDASNIVSPTASAAPVAVAAPKITSVNDVKGKGYDVKVQAKIAHSLARTPFLHMSGVEPGINKETYTYGLKTPPTIAYGRALTANNNYWACPLPVSGGFAVYVRPHSTLGRFPVKFGAYRGPATISTLSLSPHKDLLAVGSDDGVVRVFKIDNVVDGEIKDKDTPDWVFELGDARITWLGFHPYVEDVLVCAAFDATSNQDIIVSMVVSPGTEGDSVMQGFPIAHSRITDLDFCTDRVHIVAVTRDHDVFVVALPSGTVKTTFQPLQVSKEVNVRWVDDKHLLTIGFPRGSERSMTLYSIDGLYDQTTTATAIKSQGFINTNSMLPYLDIATGLLVIGNVGSSTYNTFHITPNHAPYIDVLSVFSSKTDCLSAVFLPKTAIDVKDVEIIRSIQFGRSLELWPISWRVNRKRKEFFQDDLYETGCPVYKYEGDIGNWYGGGVEATKGDVVKYISLKPDNMTNLSEAPEEELTERQQKYIAMKQQSVKEEEKRGFLGHKTSEEVAAHFLEKSNRMPAMSGRFDARAKEEHNDVEDDEWD